MLAYGVNVLKELDNKKIKKVLTSRPEIVDYCKNNHIKFEYVDNHYLNKLSRENHQGVIIDIYDYDYYSLSDLEGDFVVMLDHLEDPHNFGAIIRTCEAALVDGIIIPKNRGVSVNPTVIKVSTGAILNTKIARVTNLVNTIEYLKSKGFWIVGTDMDGTDYTEIDYSGKIALVIGNEGKGMGDLVSKNCDFIASLPMRGTTNSLNASVAAGIMIYEAIKCRK